MSARLPFLNVFQLSECHSECLDIFALMPVGAIINEEVSIRVYFNQIYMSVASIVGLAATMQNICGQPNSGSIVFPIPSFP